MSTLCCCCGVKLCCAQVAYILRPNTVKNTVPICIFNEKDTPGKLHAAFDMYKDQISELMGMAWQDKCLRVFLSGDYEFQCSNYGLSGPSDARPCLHCHCLKIVDGRGP